MANSTNQIKNFFQSKDVTMKGGQLDRSISYIGEEIETGNFVSTIDQIIFEDFSTILMKVLEAKGFVFNIENVLASIEQTKFGIRAKVQENELGVSKVEGYNFCLEIPAPSKSSRGMLLKIFYDEIKTLQGQIIDLKEKKDELESQKKVQSVQQLKDELKTLRIENANYKEKMSRINERLERSLGDLNKSSSSKIDLEEMGKGTFRFVEVVQINLLEDRINLRSSNSSFTYEISKLPELPLEGAKCIAFIEDGVVLKLFTFDKNVVNYDIYLGTILAITDDGIKVRDSERNLLFIKYKTLKQSQSALNLRVNFPILIYKYRGIVFHWVKLKKTKCFLEDLAKEEIYTKRLSDFLN